MKTLSKAVDEINAVIDGAIDEDIEIVTIQEEYSPTQIRVLLADWNYKEACVEKYGGFRWVFNHWLDLFRTSRNPMEEIGREKICILGFISEKQIYQGKDSEDIKIRNILRKIEVLLGLKTVTYLRTPSEPLENIKQAIANLVTTKPLFYPDTEQMKQCLCEIDSYERLKSYLHDLPNNYNADSLGDFEAIRALIPKNLVKELEPFLDNFKEWLKSKPIPEDLTNQDAYRKLNEKVQEGWF